MALPEFSVRPRWRGRCRVPVSWPLSAHGNVYPIRHLHAKRDSMPAQRIPVKARKTAVTLSVDASLLVRAKRLKLRLSQLFEESLADAIRSHERDEWLRKNRAALKAYNEHLMKHGVFSDGLRSF